MKRRALLLFLVFISLSGLPAQSTLADPAATASDPAMTSSQFDMTGFSQWAKDLRRGEIIAFGSFPFAYFFINFGLDSYRFATHSWDRKYAPWPLDSAASVEKTQDEKIMTLGIAAGSAVLFALVDYGIMRYKRSLKEKESRKLPAGTPIIIRKPLYGEEIFGGEISGQEIIGNDISGEEDERPVDDAAVPELPETGKP